MEVLKVLYVIKSAAFGEGIDVLRAAVISTISMIIPIQLQCSLKTFTQTTLKSESNMYKVGVDVGGPPPRSTSLSSTVADIFNQGRTQMLSFLMSRLNL